MSIGATAGPSWTHQKAASTPADDIDLDAMFDAVADLPDVDFDAIERKAEAKYASKTKKRRVNVLLSDDDQPTPAFGKKGKGKGKVEEGDKDDDEDEKKKKKKKRKPVVKLDLDRCVVAVLPLMRPSLRCDTSLQSS